MKRILFLIFSFWAIVLHSQFCFDPAVYYPVGVNTNYIAKADFNKDGKIDVVTGNIGGSSLGVFLGTGLGTLSSVTIFSTGPSPNSVITADFNNDGNIDLANTHYSGFSVLLGMGNGSFSAHTNFFTGGLMAPVSLTTADFDGDGNLDVATANNYPANNIAIFLGTGTGSFVLTNTFPTASNDWCIINGDFNSDGKADLATANTSTTNVSILLGTGTGSFLPATNIVLPGTTGSWFITKTDLENDGKLDLLVANGSANSFSVLKGNGLGGFTVTGSYTVPGNMYSIAIDDFNGDSKLDVACPMDWPSNLSLFPGDGLGGFGSLTNFSNSTSPRSAISADFNGDGNPDIATANAGSQNAAILLNNSPTITATASSTVVCKGISVTLTASGANTFTWTSGVTNGVSFIPSTTMTYSVIGTNTLNNCAGSASINVIVNSPTITLATFNTSLCAGETTILTANGAASYTWNTGSNGAAIIISPSITTTYSVIATDINGCVNSATITQNVSPCAGIEELFGPEQTLSIYPNPSEGIFNLELRTSSRVIIYTTLGEEILNENFIEGKYSLDLNDKPPGVYFIKTNIGSLKLIKD